jgi:hypothetical protein
MGHRRVADALRMFVRVRRTDLLALGVLVLLAAAFLSPSLVDGGSFGGFDLDTTLTKLGAGLYPTVHNLGNGDAVSQKVSWNALDWRMIHAGHFPFWNDDSGLGMPEFLNFESGVLGLPDLLSYLAPLRDAFLVVVFVEFAIAGTGAYAAARALKVRVPGALFAGVTFMFSGAFANWVTWPLADVVAWTGWIVAFALLAYRRSEPRYVAALSICVAFSIFGGFPESNVTMVLVLGTFFVAATIASTVLGRRPRFTGVLRCALGVLVGVGLSAPLWLPGLGVLSGSHRETEGHYPGLPMKSLPLLFSQGYLGEPFAGPTHYGLVRWNYYESVTYVGVPALVFALVALFGARRRPVVIGLGVAVVVGLSATYEPVSFHPFFSLVNHLGGLSQVRFERTKVVTGFAIAVLAAIGFDDTWGALATRRGRRRLGSAIVLVGIWVGAVAVRTVESHTSTPALLPHRSALIAPAALLVALVVVVVVGAVMHRRPHPNAARTTVWGMSALLVGQGAFVFFAGVGVPTYSHAFYPETPAETRLAAIVGDTLVGLDGGNTQSVKSFGHVGFYPEVNIGYGVRLFAIHDPVVPSTYYTSWPIPAAAPSVGGVGLFVPDIDSAALARRYGIGYILAGPGLAPPTGASKVTVLADETLYRVPGAARFSFETPRDARVTAVSGSTTSGFTVRTQGSVADPLIVRITSEPGWHATVDGHPATVRRYDGVMQSVLVPAGRHVVVIAYRPGRLVLGIGVAGATVVGGLGVALGLRRRRRARFRTAEC